MPASISFITPWNLASRPSIAGIERQSLYLDTAEQNACYLTHSLQAHDAVIMLTVKIQLTVIHRELLQKHTCADILEGK